MSSGRSSERPAHCMIHGMSRRPSRARGFAYRGCHRYFVTACTCRREPAFADASHASELATTILRVFGANAFDVLAYCIMPDHVHLLLEGLSEDADFQRAVRVWKLQAGHAWRRQHQEPLWQVGYWERVLREYDDTRAVVRYVLENPVRAGLVRRAEDYLWVGSARFTLAELAAHAGDWNPPWKGHASGQV